MSKLRLIFLIILLPIVFFRCETNNPVPQVYVNFILELNSPLYNALNTVGGSIIVSEEGYRDHGVIITRVDFDRFAAYDATCTFDPEDAWGRVELDETLISATDKVCGSQYSLMLDGMVLQQPASVPLKIYNVEYNQNQNTITVHN